VSLRFTKSGRWVNNNISFTEEFAISRGGIDMAVQFTKSIESWGHIVRELNVNSGCSSVIIDWKETEFIISTNTWAVHGFVYGFNEGSIQSSSSGNLVSREDCCLKGTWASLNSDGIGCSSVLFGLEVTG